MAIQMRLVSVVLIAYALLTLAREAHVTSAEPQSEVGALTTGDHKAATSQGKASAEPAEAASTGAVRPAQAEPKKAEQEFEVGGRVVDPDGKPLPGAKVYLIHGPRPEVRAVTDAEGKFQFRMKRAEFALNESGIGWDFAHILAASEGYGADFRTASSFEVSGKLGASVAFPPYPLAPQWDRTLRLVNDDVPVRGRIVDRKGKPVAGAKVSVLQVWVTQQEDLTQWVEAAERGEDYDTTRRLMDRGPWMNKIDTVMPTATTGADGRFCLRGIGRERIAELSIEGPGIASDRVYARTRPGPTLRLLHVLEDPRAGTYCYYGAAFEHVARPSVPIVGTVRDNDTGKPLGGVSIRGQAGVPIDEAGEVDVEFHGGGCRVTTDAQGRYRLTGLPVGRQYQLIAVPLDGLYLPSAKAAEPGDGRDAVQLDFALKRGVTIRGQVTDARKGEPVQQAFVTYFAFADNPQTRSAPFYEGEMVHHWDEPNLTDEQGRYAVAGLPGRGLVAALAKDSRDYSRGGGPGLTKGREPGWPSVCLKTEPFECVPANYHYVAELNVADGAEGCEHNIVLDSLPAWRLQGDILDPAGQPLSGCFFHGYQSAGNAFDFLNSGTFTVRLDRADQVRRLLFVHKERKLAGSLVVKGAAQGPLSVRLQPWGVVSGRVVDAQGKPKASVLIRGWQMSVSTPPDCGFLPELHYRTDQQGRFRIEGLVAGMKYDLEVIENYKIVGLLAGGVTVESGQTKDLGDVTVQPTAGRTGEQ